jgi:hypothetical protein
MKEVEFIDLLASVYTSIADKAEEVNAENLSKVTKMSIQVFDGDDTTNPPTGEVISVDYYVVNRGTDSEAVYVPKGTTLPIAEVVTKKFADKGVVISIAPVSEIKG